MLLLGVGSWAAAPAWATGATLAVAAVFQPARRRVQALVDRRFNRRRYDAARTIEAFSGRLREQVDLDTLSSELLKLVEQTMQPTLASLWLRQAASAAGGGQTPWSTRNGGMTNGMTTGAIESEFALGSLDLLGGASTASNLRPSDCESVSTRPRRRA